MVAPQSTANIVLTQAKKQTLHFRAIFGVIIALLFAGTALCHAEAPSKILEGIKYTKVGKGMCRASMIEGDPWPYKIKSPITIDGEECRVTSISDMGINAVTVEDPYYYRYRYVNYKIKFPEFVDTICEFCFTGRDACLGWDFTSWADLTFPKSKVIESQAFATCTGSIIIPEGVEEIGSMINGENYAGPTIISLPSTLKRMSACGVTIWDSGNQELIIWAKTPPEIIPAANGCTLPINTCYLLGNHYTEQYFTIYVPEEAVEAYKAAPGWSKIANIKSAGGYYEDINSIRYTMTGNGICDAQALSNSSATGTITIPQTVTLQGQVCKVTSISNMTVNKESKVLATGMYEPDNSYTEPSSWSVSSFYPVMTCNYRFPSTVEVIGERCFYQAEWPNLQLPNSIKEIRDEAFYEFGMGQSVYSNGEYRKEYSRLIVPDGVTSIGFNINYMTDLACLPNSLQTMSSRAIWFDDSKDVERNATNSSITSYATIPPTILPDPVNSDYMVVNFNSGIPSRGTVKRSGLRVYPEWFTLYVPEGTVEAYRAAPGWCDIPHILPMGANAVDGVAADGDGVRFEVVDGSITAVNSVAPVEVYATDGRRVAVGADGTVSGLDAGLYIVRCGAATTKLIVR